MLRECRTYAYIRPADRSLLVGQVMAGISLNCSFALLWFSESQPTKTGSEAKNKRFGALPYIAWYIYARGIVVLLPTLANEDGEGDTAAMPWPHCWWSGRRSPSRVDNYRRDNDTSDVTNLMASWFARPNWHFLIRR